MSTLTTKAQNWIPYSRSGLIFWKVLGKRCDSSVITDLPHLNSCHQQSRQIWGLLSYQNAILKDKLEVQLIRLVIIPAKGKKVCCPLLLWSKRSRCITDKFLKVFSNSKEYTSNTSSKTSKLQTLCSLSKKKSHKNQTISFQLQCE